MAGRDETGPVIFDMFLVLFIFFLPLPPPKGDNFKND